MEYNLIIRKTISWLFGIAVFAAGIVNMFWGNDFWFGVFILLLSFIYFSPVDVLLERVTGFTIPVIIKIILALFIVWATVGVGELFDKIEMMMQDISGE